MHEDYDYNYMKYQLRRNSLRKYIRRYYFNKIKKNVIGKAVDFGCGIGELLKQLPADSIGYEVNSEAVKYCRNIGLNVYYYDIKDEYEFNDLKKNDYETFILNHVLEHIVNPEIVMQKIFHSLYSLNIKRIIIVVPGYKGFLSDSTHKKYLDENFFLSISNNQYFEIVEMYYFPINNKFAGKIFVHNELTVLFDNNNTKIHKDGRLSNCYFNEQVLYFIKQIRGIIN